MTELAIYGTGGLGREALEIAEAERCWRIAGFLDDDAKRHGELVNGHRVLGGGEWLRARADTHVAIAIGSPAIRARVRSRLDAIGHKRFATLVHPRAHVGTRVAIGEGSIVFAGVSITTDATLGRHVVVNPGATIAHDVTLGDFALVAPAAAISGNVHVGDGADIGTNATILQGLRVGAWSILGAGAVVLEDVPPDATVVGVPARVIRTRAMGWQKEK